MTVIPRAEQNKRYLFLDALRGIAAIFVLIYHIGTRLGGHNYAPGGFLAVDFFFALSGVVIASAYENKIGRTMSFVEFLRRRATRLFPMSVLGLLLGTIYLLLRWQIDPSRSDTLETLVAATVVNLFLIPKFWLGTASGAELFPANGALWSLFFELLINLFWAIFLVRRTTRMLVLFALAGGLLTTYVSVLSGTADVGWELWTFAGGVGRVTFGFTIGVLIYRIRNFLPTNFQWSPICALAIILIFILAPFQSVYWHLFGVLVGMPLAVVLGLMTGARKIIPGDDLLGRISYPLYVIHVPLLMFASGTQKFLFPASKIGPAHLLLVLPICLSAFLVLIYYDEPVRKWLFARHRENRA